MEKKIFTEPAVEVVCFTARDIIAASGGVDLPFHSWDD